MIILTGQDFDSGASQLREKGKTGYKKSRNVPARVAAMPRATFQENISARRLTSKDRKKIKMTCILVSGVTTLAGLLPRAT